ncbi:MAG: hypothetical protein HOP12_01005 [Candidatus Eisenbacteria bacterium]|uniref:Lipoprotein n=1 Tax=Eiseniibacteriota bacterium TaxID=2212470 RepID=A0A849SEA5_UNCEI|nr:hypothetical protein [Candidatus Eisenbacteria bacterium]
MRRLMMAVLMFAFAMTMSGCYAARVETGLTPSTQVIKKDWAACWVFGLVPPPTLQMASYCPNGVAVVETQLSFLNMVVGNLTFGIFTPMTIRVTCAEKSTSSLVEPAFDFALQVNASDREIRETFNDAARMAMKTGRAVLVQLPSN